jgi:hypothetical protein
MTMVTPSETYATGSGDRLGLHPVCKTHSLARFIRNLMFNQVDSNFILYELLSL